MTTPALLHLQHYFLIIFVQGNDSRKEEAAGQPKFQPVAPRWTSQPFPSRTSLPQSQGRVPSPSVHAPGTSTPGNLSRRHSSGEIRVQPPGPATAMESARPERQDSQSAHQTLKDKQPPLLHAYQAQMNRRPSPAGLRPSQPQAQNPAAPRFNPQAGFQPLGPMGRVLSLQRGPPLAQPDPAGRPLAPQRQGEQAQPRGMPDFQSGRMQQLAEGQGLPARRLAPEASRQPAALQSRPPSQGNRQGLQPRAGPQHAADERQLSRAGEQLLMLVRLGDLKLPATVRKPKPIGDTLSFEPFHPCLDSASIWLSLHVSHQYLVSLSEQYGGVLLGAL